MTSMIYQCDNCNRSPLEGVRYRCNQCSNEFDLCETCKNIGVHFPEHTFTRHVIESVLSRSNSDATIGGQMLPSGPSTESGASRPPRRSTAGKGSSYSIENALERMDDVLAKTNVGPIPATFASTNIASQVLECYEAGITATERHKKGRILEQINARVATALANIPFRVRHGSNFVKRQITDVADQEILTAALAGFIAQVIAWDTEKTFLKLESATQDDNTAKDVIDLEKLRSNVDSGFYFRRVELPTHALISFSKHLMRVFSRASAFGVPEQICQRAERVVRQALDELRDAFGLDSQILGPDGDERESPSPTSQQQQQNGGGAGSKKARSSGPALSHPPSSQTLISAAPSSGMSSSSSATAPPMTAAFNPWNLQNGQAATAGDKARPSSIVNDLTKKDKDKKRKRDETEESDSAATSMVPPPAPFRPATMRVSDSELTELRNEMKRMREELDDAHSRIDVLIHLLREKIANPLIRGLDRAGR